MRRLDRRAFLRLTGLGAGRRPRRMHGQSAIVAAPFSDAAIVVAAGRPPSTEAAMLAWLRGYHDAVRSAIRPGAYANYADPDPVDWPEAYYARTTRARSA